MQSGVVQNNRLITLIVEGLPNIDDAYLDLQLHAKGILPLTVKKIKNGTQHYYLLDFDLDKLKSQIVEIRKVKEIAHQKVKISYYISQNCARYDEDHELIAVVECSRCQTYGHEARRCIRPVACGKCAKPHLGINCSINLKANFAKSALLCINCNGNHTTFSYVCPIRRDVQRNFLLYGEATTFPVNSLSSSRRSSISTMSNSDAGSSSFGR